MIRPAVFLLTLCLARSATLRSVSVIPFKFSLSSAVADCYKLTATKAAKTDTAREGTPLTPTEKAGVQAAVNRVKEWVVNCQMPSTPGAPSDPGVQLQGLLDGGHICKETKATAKDVGATSSNPIAGNGADGNGVVWGTTGHPGINITGPHIPLPDSSGAFDTAAVTVLAGMLAHELHHINNSNVTSDYESDATKYEADLLCQIAGCSAASTKDKEAACKRMKDLNAYFCKNKKAQVDCAACSSLTPPINPKVPCTGSGGGNPPMNGLVDPFPYDESGFPIQKELYARGNVRGSLILDPLSSLVSFTFVSQTVSCDFDLDLTASSGYGIVPLDLEQTGAGTVVVSGYDRSAHTGKLLQFTFNPSSCSHSTGTLIYQGSNFLEPAGISLIPGTSKLAILDSANHCVYVHDMQLGTTTLVNTPAATPELLDMTYIHATTYPPQGMILVATSVPYQEAVGWPFGTSVRMLDENGDGVFELSY